MHVRIRGRRGASTSAAHLRAAALLRGAAARPLVHRGAGHHRPHLRHLPGRLPDERLPRRSRTRCGVDGRRPLRALRRLLYCGEWIESHALHVYMLHAPDFLGYESAHRDGPRPPRGRRARAAAEEGRQRADRADRRARDPPDQRPGRRLLPGARPARAGARCATRSSGRARPRSRRSLGGRPRLPRLRARLRVRRAARRPDEYPIDRGRIVSDPRARHRRRGVRRARSSRSTSRTRTRCTPACASAAPTWSGPLARFNLNFDRLSPLARRGGARGRARRRRAATRSRASSCAPSRSSTPATRRCA